MRFADEVLMAYADGELRGELRAEVQRAIETDPDVARRVAEHEAMRQSVRAVFSTVLAEPVPERLITAVRRTEGARVDADGAPIASKVVPLPRVRRARPSLPQWAALAASFLLGAGAWQLISRGAGPMIVERGGHLVASGTLAQALSNQLVPDQTASSPVRIGISFRSKSGTYCRTFVVPSNMSAGLACRDRERWRLQVLGSDQGAATNSSGYRQASSALPPWLAQQVDTVIAGEALDAQAEASARARDWH